ncbi:pyridoxamine 5'-phosphate oxidase family protein [Sphaerisporangium fuscum]|uniref:pyridoxamine 5'-phosphate oxidase family protein n=1 Tax=Sphaerisporangium fuscum TaxID=2835868 RepID=UPI001BDDBF3B|nr:pyridoxamine 5'-phosphate oxidase family protein [Sphaerisporangium fuscum]
MTVLDPELAATIDAYRTCEFATLGRDGGPLPWPTAVRRRADGTLLVTTSLAFAQKALNVRRDGRVALLFSDPTGSGLDGAPQVFIGGTAVCPEEIVTSAAGLEDYWTMLFERQPDSRKYVAPPARWLMDWYYMRLLITVTPAQVIVRPPLAPAEGEGGSVAGDDLPGAALLARFPSAVLGARDPSGAPVLLRTRPEPTGGGFAVDVPPDCEVAAGPAALLVHRHDDRLANMRNALVRGELRPEGGRWVLVPGKVVEPAGSGGPGDVVRTLRDARRATRSYLRRRGLPRPRVRWDEFKRLAAAAEG